MLTKDEVFGWKHLLTQKNLGRYTVILYIIFEENVMIRTELTYFLPIVYSVFASLLVLFLDIFFSHWTIYKYGTHIEPSRQVIFENSAFHNSNTNSKRIWENWWSLNISKNISIRKYISWDFIKLLGSEFT